MLLFFVVHGLWWIILLTKCSTSHKISLLDKFVLYSLFLHSSVTIAPNTKKTSKIFLRFKIFKIRQNILSRKKSNLISYMKNIRSCKFTWFNKPFSNSLQRNIVTQFWKILETQFSQTTLCARHSLDVKWKYLMNVYPNGSGSVKI